MPVHAAVVWAGDWDLHSSTFVWLKGLENLPREGPMDNEHFVHSCRVVGALWRAWRAGSRWRVGGSRAEHAAALSACTAGFACQVPLSLPLGPKGKQQVYVQYAVLPRPLPPVPRAARAVNSGTLSSPKCTRRALKVPLGRKLRWPRPGRGPRSTSNRNSRRRKFCQDSDGLFSTCGVASRADQRGQQ